MKRNTIIEATAAVMLGIAFLSAFLIAGDDPDYIAIGAVAYIISMLWLGAFIYANRFWKGKSPVKAEENPKMSKFNFLTSLKEIFRNVNHLS